MTSNDRLDDLPEQLAGLDRFRIAGINRCLENYLEHLARRHLQNERAPNVTIKLFDFAEHGTLADDDERRSSREAATGANIYERTRHLRRLRQ